MTTDAVGGVWIYATDLARELCNRGCAVTLVVIGPPPPPEHARAVREIEGLHLELTDLLLEWMDPEGTDTSRAHERLLSIAERAHPDVVHLNSYREANFDWPAPVLVVAHSCVWSWFIACRGEPPCEPRWNPYAAAVASALLAADAWSAPTAAFRDSIESRYRTRSCGRVIPNGVDLPIFDGPKAPFILAAGRLWDEAKNLALLQSVAPRLDWPVHAAGPLHAPGAYMERRPGKEIAWLGELSRAQLITQMQRAGIFAAPAANEPFGLSILEAAACGCALVLGDVPSLRELWGDAAVFVDPRDPDALAGALQSLCRNDPWRTRMQAAARARARRYPLKATVSAYQDLYETMAGKSSAHRPALEAISAAECRA
jgi:glycosyltransferase involved in cell wall biosynthesis